MAEGQHTDQKYIVALIYAPSESWVPVFSPSACPMALVATLHIRRRDDDDGDGETNVSYPAENHAGSEYLSL